MAVRFVVTAGAVLAWYGLWQTGSGWLLAAALFLSALVPLAWWATGVEVARYERDADGEWVEVSRRGTGGRRRSNPNEEAPWDRL
jgi:hypothetical protein